MDLVIRGELGGVLSKVENVVLFAPASTYTTRHGSFSVDEIAIDYVKNEINVYSSSCTISREFEDEYNEWGVFLVSK